ncbi:MAG: phosphate acyltransferase PlsX [bacterium]|nr:phosphate acyltransferase PlsX [bacterium]
MTDNICNVAVDAMGGDFAPASVIDGAKLAVKESGTDLHVTLVGIEEKIYEAAPDIDDYKESISVVHASEVIEMCDPPVVALKEKKNSSINVVSGLLKRKKADAILSVGNTGAFMAASLFAAGKIEGVVRPTIGTFYPRKSGEGFFLDVGGNTDCKPHQLFQFGIMGSTFFRLFKGILEPSIGLLSIGEEPSKGNAVTIETHKLLSESRLNFKGNIEGDDIFSDKCDVVVCDGFIGNVLLKFMESIGGLFESLFYSSLKGDSSTTDKAVLDKPINKLKDAFNYEKYGGVPILGINGVSIIGHGRSSPEAVKTAILLAQKMFKAELPDQIRKNIETYKESS